MKHPHSNIISFEQYHGAIAAFRSHLNSDDAKPRYNSYGTKFHGCMRYEHFLFYALLRNKPVETATHDTESGSFREIIFELKSAADIGAGYYLNSILDIFPLYKEQVINIIISSKL